MQRSALQKNVNILKYKTLSFNLSRESKQNANKVGKAKKFFFGARLLVRTASNWSFELMTREIIALQIDLNHKL